MSIFTKFLNEETSQKFTQVKDGTYKAQLKDIALEEGLYTEYGKADKVHFSFGIINEEKEVNTVEDAIAGALDIIAEAVSDEADYRAEIRRMTKEDGKLISQAKDAEEKSVYENYYDFEEAVSKLTGYKVLALNRGEKEKFLNVKITVLPDRIIRYLEKNVIVKDNMNPRL